MDKLSRSHKITYVVSYTQINDAIFSNVMEQVATHITQTECCIYSYTHFTLIAALSQ